MQRYHLKSQRDFFGLLLMIHINLIFMFALVTGMRQKNILLMQWKDVDFERQTVIFNVPFIPQTWGENGGYLFTEPKTSQSRRTIQLPIKIIQALQVHKRNQSEHRLRISTVYENLDMVFATKKVWVAQ